MEKLLQWAVKNTDNDELAKQAAAIRRGEAQPDPKRYDPKILEAILGKDDATRMKDAVACISDPQDTVDNKVIALDNLELLIEGIDNARNIENMKLWPQVIAQLDAEAAEVRKGTAWVCGTAVQNNAEAQKAFLSHGGLEPLLKLLSDEDEGVRNKALYAISGFLKHHEEGVKAFSQLNGFTVLHDILKDASTKPVMLRKVVFLYNSLVFDNQQLAAELVQDDTFADIQNVLAKYTNEEEDEDMVEKCLRVIHSIVVKAPVKPDQQLKKQVADAKAKYGQENLQLATEEWKDLE